MAVYCIFFIEWFLSTFSSTGASLQEFPAFLPDFDAGAVDFLEVGKFRCESLVVRGKLRVLGRVEICNLILVPRFRSRLLEDSGKATDQSVVYIHSYLYGTGLMAPIIALPKSYVLHKTLSYDYKVKRNLDTCSLNMWTK